MTKAGKTQGSQPVTSPVTSPEADKAADGSHRAVVAFLSLPRTADEKNGFKTARDNLWNRMAAKAPGKLGNDDRFSNRPVQPKEQPLVFNSFKEVEAHYKKGGWISKLYVQAHGTPTHITTGSKGKSEETLNGAGFADALWNAGLSERMEKGLPDNNKALLKIRSLACRTGDESGPAPSWRAEMHKTLEQKLTEKMNGGGKRQGIHEKQSVTLRSKAPKGWQVLWNDGKAIGYFATDKRTEADADAMLKKAMQGGNARLQKWDHDNIDPKIMNLNVVESRATAYTTGTSLIYRNVGRHDAGMAAEAEAPDGLPAPAAPPALPAAPAPSAQRRKK